MNELADWLNGDSSDMPEAYIDDLISKALQIKIQADERFRSIMKKKVLTEEERKFVEEDFWNI